MNTGIAISETTHARHLVELGYIERYLSATGFSTMLLERSAELPIHSLMVALGGDEENPPAAMLQFNFIPVDEDLEHISLLQLYCLFMDDLAESTGAQVEKLLLAINSKLPLGHVSVKAPGEVFYRYVYTKPKQSLIVQEEITEVTTLFLGVLQRISPLVVGLALGNVSLAEALRDIEDI